MNCNYCRQEKLFDLSFSVDLNNNSENNSTMRIELSTVFWLLLNTSASSFGTKSPSSSLRSLPFTATTTAKTAFLTQRGGGDDKFALKASEVETASSGSKLSDANLDLLSERGKQAVLNLIEHDVDGAQSHVYGDWPEPGTQDDDKIRLAEQVSSEWH